MPSSMLFGINNEGRVYSLYTNGTKWREFPYLGVEFKRLSSVPNFLWAIGGDRQIYVHVHGFDIPIRIREEVYENQRWNPIEGFVSRLLPTDRYQWSNKDGTQNRTLESIRLPSFAWEWESSWTKDLTLDGQPLDHDGWTYAIDFPNTYTPTKTWSSGVRRRKWFRYRKYSAMNAWCAIAPLYKDSTQEPFIDVCVGGHLMPGDAVGMMLVWAVTAHGRLMFRSGVGRESPEGKRWIPVPLPTPHAEVKHISCGPAGLTWIVLWTGDLYVRTHVTTATPMGEDWVLVSPPSNESKVCHVSMGTHSVWVTTENHTVWFRRGVTSQDGCGTAWIEMSGKMKSVSVAPNDQVWAVGVSDQLVYYRSGVTPTELTGRSWRPVKAPIQLSRHSTQSNSLLSLGMKSTGTNSGTEDTSWDDEAASKSAPTRLITDRPPCDSNFSNDSMTSRQSSAVSTDCVTVNKSRLWCPLQSVGSLLGMEVNPDTDDSGLDVDTERDAFLEKQNESLACVQNTKWSCVEAGAVLVSPNNVPRWFCNASVSIDEKETWRQHILDNLEERRMRELRVGANYETAIEITSWVRAMTSKVSLEGGKMEDVQVEIEWNGVEADVLESATVRILSLDRGVKKHEINLRDVVHTESSSEPGVPRVSLYTVGKTHPLVFQLSTDAEHDDLLSNMMYVCSALYRIRSNPSSKSYWATTRLGEVLTFDPLVAQGFQAQEKHQFCQMFNLNNCEIPVTRQLVNSFPPGTQLSVTGHIPKSATRFSINLECGSNQLVALHVNPRFDQKEIVRNHFANGFWGIEDTYGPMGMDVGTDFIIVIQCDEHGFRIERNGYLLGHFECRLDPATITQVTIQGNVRPLTIKYLSDKPIFEESGIYWRQIGGHLRQVETCDIGVTWGIGFDKTPWVYTGGWGGSSLVGSKQDMATITDTQTFEVYENQRWNPISGYSARGLPTDRPTWSDVTGTERRSKESCVLMNTHWHWETDWCIDYNIEGGTDKEGWQFALDFPCVFHATNNFTDTVRRRRWLRVARYVAQGPWSELGNTKLTDLSLHTDTGGNIRVWGLVAKGDALYRRDVSLETPCGVSWEHVSHDETLVNISGYNNQVWAVGENGCAYWRYGITGSNPMGESWKCIDPPRRASLVQIAVGDLLVWARDSENNLYTRLGLSPVCGEGTQWQTVPEQKMKHLCISKREVWGITLEGNLTKRLGVTKDNPGGYCWVFTLPGEWTHLSVKQ
ncbi:hypothetical protein WDU94_011602 [Cyamophila willieti]